MAIDWEREVADPNVAVFGETATLYPAGGGAAILFVGVFDEAYRETEIIDSLSYTTDARPAIGVTDGQFGAHVLAQNDRLILTDAASRHFGKKFIVAEPKADGQGHTLLKLNVWEGALP